MVEDRIDLDVDPALVDVDHDALRRVVGEEIEKLGVVNLAKDGDANIALVSFFAKGRTHVDGWATENGHLHVGVVNGGRVVHNVCGIGQRITKDGDDEPILV